MKWHQGVWSSARAEAAFRRIEDQVWAERFPEGVDSRDVATSFGPTRAYRWPGTGLPVVLLHGIGGTSLMWAPYVVAGGFGGHPLVAIDTMGDVGRSRHDRAFTGPDDVAQWLQEALSSLGVERAHVVGGSYGGWLAVNQALRHPADVASLTLLEPAGLAPVDRKRFLRWGLSVLAAGALPRPLRTRAAERLRMPVLHDRRAMRMLRRGQVFHRFRPQPEPFTAEELGRITVPVTLLVGEHSELHDPHEVVDRADQCLPDVRTHVVPGAGHALPLTHVEEVREAWLRSRRDGEPGGGGPHGARAAECDGGRAPRGPHVVRGEEGLRLGAGVQQCRPPPLR
jgi:pimeloyl-ACP methyl ester carboxylesterase